MGQIFVLKAGVQLCGLAYDKPVLSDSCVSCMANELVENNGFLFSMVTNKATKRHTKVNVVPRNSMPSFSAVSKTHAEFQFTPVQFPQPCSRS